MKKKGGGQNIKKRKGLSEETEKRMKNGKSVRGSNRQMYDSVSNPNGREGIRPLTAASRPDEV